MKHAFLSLFILLSVSAIAQNNIYFQVNDEEGESLIGATIVIDGTTNGGTTDAEGKYHFQNIPNGSINFVISYVGYEPQSKTLLFPESDGKTIDIVMESGEELGEVIVSATRSSRTIETVTSPKTRTG